MNAAQKLEAALERVEIAAAELRQAALKFARGDTATWDGVCRDRDLAKAARRYANAQNSVRRASRA